MSLNWREIDAILTELNLEDCWLKKVRQPDYARIILEFSRPGFGCALELVLKAPFVRLNRLGSDRRIPKALARPPRFTAVLKARIEGSRLCEVRQLGRDRIVRFTFGNPDPLHLDAKLWGNAANIILADDKGEVIDSFSRRPKKGEAPGAPWPPEGIDTIASETESYPDKEKYKLRNLPEDGDWNTRIEKHYLVLEADEQEKIRINLWNNYLMRRETSLILKAERLSANTEGFKKQNRDGHWADIIMANLHIAVKGDNRLEAEDWEEPETMVQIPLKITLSPKENAEAYYTRGKRARRALERLEEDRQVLEKSLASNQELIHRLESGETESSPFNENPPEEKRQKKHSSTPILPGLWIRKNPYIIVVGRNSRESDFLLRRWAKGNDMWLHVRDWPGAYVFIRTPRGKSIPLDILLDAANLALSYSKGKSAMEADLYYTQVKNLRRAKDAPLGTVLPTREKNLRVRLETRRLEALKELAESG